MHAILSNPQAMRYWATPPHETLDQTQAWIAAMIAVDPAESDDFIVEHEGRAIGKAGLWRAPEIGFILSPDVWGRGFATEALAAIIPRAFARFAMDAITADVDPRNTASLRVLARAGFVETGHVRRTLKVGGEWCDSIYLKRWR
jgi:RimJ/RimL family protein N-acetyltransferase